ncbi:MULTISPECIES: murein L,D-transpeptidase catalytic domain family protein [Legionella]|uniref:Murein L,D-transpeptidase catalytic domain family protein n=1 Tax=Legionella drozanskii LLAP-1 TaxID=1212489 RepID=A0A0W0TBX9_9GAMM|nr:MULTISPECIES: murein L,D-transpeptidase catalytic domain family protein [Legionella]KTC93132.1 hypothetical protein Ldro_0503 [Legionella drozanskii LLAP-1]PJE09365.1 MAG: hypothetical protein CK430_11270 [Legionella sp.]
MRKTLLWMLAVTSTCCFSQSSHKHVHEKVVKKKDDNQILQIIALISPDLISPKATNTSLKEIENMLVTSSLNKLVVDKVLKTLKCAGEYNVDHNNILTIIDYSLPSSEKRLWVFDLYAKKLLYHTYVSHGIKSGTLLSTSFSNKYNSKSSSIGVYKTEDTYYGRHGLSLKLDGLDPGFNDNASNRSVVMHGGWYVDESFIKKYGRAGRSWGCPALPENITSDIINTIKDRSLFVIYYPSDNWFVKSKFLNCDNVSPTRYASTQDTEIKSENEHREPVLFANINRKNLGNEPILVITADNYEQIFHAKAPLERMLRRQINNIEYIALSNAEFENLIINNKNALNTVNFVIPVVKMERGYYATEMHIVDLGKIKDVRLTSDTSSSTHQVAKSYTIDFEAKPSITLRSTNEFIRWLGL